jgi:hypothetical protein
LVKQLYKSRSYC